MSVLRRSLVHAAAAGTLGPVLLACCFFPSSSAPTSPPTTLAPPTLAPGPAIEPLPAPVVGGHPFPFLASQLVMDLPAGVDPPRAPVDAEPPIPGMLARDRLELPALDLVVSDLPCTAPIDLEGSARAELARRHPGLLPGLASRPFPIADATLRAVELVPSVAERLPDNETAVAFVALDMTTHVVWIRAEVQALEPRLDPAARAQAETVLQTLRRGTTTFVPHLEDGDTLGDLVGYAPLPPGWIARAASCCNEEPPYRSWIRESFLPMRELGASPRARISVRHGVSCAAGRPGPAGVVLGRPMRWTRTDVELCWVEIAPPADELGITWHVRGRTQADLDEALAIVPSIRRPE